MFLYNLVLLAAFILAMTNIFGYTAISWWIIGALVVVPMLVSGVICVSGYMALRRLIK